MFKFLLVVATDSAYEVLGGFKTKSEALQFLNDYKLECPDITGVAVYRIA